MLLELKKIKKYFPVQKGFLSGAKDFVRAVDGVDLDLAQGENLGLVGESGCGKTTLGRLILKLYPPDSGQMIFDGQDITSLSAREMRPLRREIQMVFQDPYSSLDPRFRIGDVIREAMLLDKTLKKEDQNQKIRELLLAVGLPSDIINRFPHEFSGGERQRIAIARALAMHPKLLILDEAVSSLDVLVQEQIIELLLEVQKKFKLTYLFITHNLRVVRKISARIAVMSQGRIVETAKTADILEGPLHPYTKELLTAALHYQPVSRQRDFKIDGNSVWTDAGQGHWVLKS